MKLATILGSIGCSIDLIGAWWIAQSFITARSWQIAEGATQCWGYNPYVLRERCRQVAEAKVGAIFLIIGFFFNLCAWYMSESQFTLKISWYFALILLQ
ncbi:hypothetical protein SEF58_03380 [Neomoorella humiferrea]|uniref:Uncharacterized protein n=1 Tax=Neomoorella humiferrea TaxID=676965 RepID=A0A2T0AV83_9FIRM|nr:hypothetical protein [Moorella humiferrea]PRR74514.1 hypothetical protein MOHU_08270 [Moorella humiferrea]